MVQLVDEVREIERGDQSLDFSLRLRQPREDPALFERTRTFIGRYALAGGNDQPRDVPELVRKLAPFLDRSFGEAHVLRGRHLHEAVPHCVRAVRFDHGNRVHSCAETLRHAPPGRSVHRRVDDDVGERDVAH